VRMAQKYGQGDIDGLKQAVGVSARLSIVIAAVSLLVAQLGLPVFMQLLQVPSDLKPMAMLYSRIVLGGIPFMMFFNFCAATLRAVGDSKTPLIAMIVASLTNIVLDCIAVFALNCQRFQRQFRVTAFDQRVKTIGNTAFPGQILHGFGAAIGLQIGDEPLCGAAMGQHSSLGVFYGFDQKYLRSCHDAPSCCFARISSPTGQPDT